MLLRRIPPRPPPSGRVGLRLVVHNKVNGEPVVRPTWMTDTDEWSVDYELKELSDVR
jgi:hypothetical protein